MAELPDEIIRKDTELNPVSVHVALGNRLETISASSKVSSVLGFKEFILEFLSKLEPEASVPDITFYHFDFPDKEEIQVPDYVDSTYFMTSIAPLISKYHSFPKLSFNIADVIYCCMNRIHLLSHYAQPENLILRRGYTEERQKYMDSLPDIKYEIEDMAFMKISDMDLNDFPASLYIAVGDKDNALIRVDESSNFEFERFISSVVQLYAGQNVIPDLWLYRLDFPEKKMIPDKDDPKFKEKLDKLIKGNQIKPEGVIPLRDAYYITANQICLFTKESERSYLKRDLVYLREAIASASSLLPCCTAIKTHAGTLLFSQTVEGETALNNYITHICNSRYGKEAEKSKLEIYDIPLVSWLDTSKLDAALQYCNFTETLNGKISRLPESVFVSDDITKLGVCSERYPVDEQYLDKKSYFVYQNAGRVYYPYLPVEISALENLLVRNKKSPVYLGKYFFEVLEVIKIGYEDSENRPDAIRNAKNFAKEIIKANFPTLAEAKLAGKIRHIPALQNKNKDNKLCL